MIIAGVVGQPAELRRSQGGDWAGRGANRRLTSLGGQGFTCRGLGVMHLGINCNRPSPAQCYTRSRWVTGRIKDKIMGTAEDTASRQLTR